MTPVKIARFMASMFSRKGGPLRLLDPGAGQGALSCALLEAWKGGFFTFQPDAIDAFEIDSLLLPTLRKNVEREKGNLAIDINIRNMDFIEHAVHCILCRERPYTHAILNPPYKKIRGDSRHRLILRDVGIETVNLYSAFVALSLAMLIAGWQMVAIIPRSFCNGPYFKPFREFIRRHSSIVRIHLFEARNKAFKADKVLQENVIIMLERDTPQGDVTISTSADDTLRDYSSNTYPFAKIVYPGDPQSFFHVPINGGDTLVYPGLLSHSLSDIDIEVSTGPVIDFRMKEFLRYQHEPGDAPLLYPAHLNERVKWPIDGFKKPNAIAYRPETMKWLYPTGFYVGARRVSSKEEKRRIVANTIDPSRFPGMGWLGFENHLNIFHRRKQGISERIARGLTVYLNSSFIDNMIRRFSGHTQVNATDLRSLQYPSRATLEDLGKWAQERKEFGQEAIDHIMETILK
jgi:adenine-specific DNA-methyltransferase